MKNLARNIETFPFLCACCWKTRCGFEGFAPFLFFPSRLLQIDTLARPPLFQLPQDSIRRQPTGAPPLAVAPAGQLRH